MEFMIWRNHSHDYSEMNDSIHNVNLYYIAKRYIRLGVVHNSGLMYYVRDTVASKSLKSERLLTRVWRDLLSIDWSVLNAVACLCPFL